MRRDVFCAKFEMGNQIFGLDFFFGTICRNTLTLSETRLVLEGVTIDQKPLNDSKNHIHPLRRIAKFHLDFEGVHPFIDGNGRTGPPVAEFCADAGRLFSHRY